MDLDSRIGKAPGGYNCPLPETGVPFIFMNAAGTVNDLITMMHEGGHAIHSFLAHQLPLAAFKEYPMEIAELASMSMELFTLEHWQQFFETEVECKRAQWEELERVIDVLPWIATIDKFQHWLYMHPGHSVADGNSVGRKYMKNLLRERFPGRVLKTIVLRSGKSNCICLKSLSIISNTVLHN